MVSDVRTSWATQGYVVFEPDQAVLAWARAAHAAAVAVANDPAARAANLRHRQTWFVGVGALPNAGDGSVSGVPLAGAWRDLVAPPDRWHAAQLSIVYPGYPQRDPDESEANHRYRSYRFAAHVDGLLPIGPERRRYLREPHAFILGVPLNATGAAPLMVWPGSHFAMGTAFREAVGGAEAAAVDLTDSYHSARRRVFDAITPLPLPMQPGQAVLMHRHLLHGVDVWRAGVVAPPEGRMVAYFRPEFSTGANCWLAADVAVGAGA